MALKPRQIFERVATVIGRAGVAIERVGESITDTAARYPRIIGGVVSLAVVVGAIVGVVWVFK